jgi:protein-L-isoaspartate(D-aspartate) O-methyltransferase
METPSSAAALRASLVEALWKIGALHDLEVDRALRTVPRHLFLPASSLDEAYADMAVATHWEGEVAVSSASQPAIVALMLEQLCVVQGMRVLEIGAGTGYNAALLAELVGPSGTVTTVDIDPEIVAEAQEHLAAAGYVRVAACVGDGRDGWTASAPYDRIILTVGADDIWPAWYEQLAEDGVLVLPLQLAGGQVSVALRKRGGVLASESVTPCGFMRLRGGAATGPMTVALPDGRRLSGERAAEIAGPVAALLRTRPQIRVGRRLDARLLQCLGFRLSGLRVHNEIQDEAYAALAGQLVTLFPKRFDGRGRRVRHGVYTEGLDGPSLALFASALPLLWVFGGPAAARLVEDALAYRTPAILPVDQWRIEASPCAAAPPVPAGALRLIRRHFAFDVWASGPRPQGIG